MIEILTYNDLLEIGENERDRMDFVLDAIREHKGSELYKTAYDAELYYKHQNPTIMRFQKWVYNMYGQKVPDIWSPNNKIASNWYNYFTTQAVSYLLGNGVTFKNEANKKKLGKDFDKRVQDIATHAKNGGVAFGFWNNDHVECFSINEFVPLKDEDDSLVKAGIRFWQIDDSKPLRATLYELDGYTDYIKRKNEEIEILVSKRPYVNVSVSTKAEGEINFTGRNYPGFPIVPLYNVNEQSDIVGNRGTIDAHDLIRRCEKILDEYEQRLHLLEHYLKIKKMVGAIHEYAEEISGCEDKNVIQERITDIQRISSDILEQY